MADNKDADAEKETPAPAPKTAAPTAKTEMVTLKMPDGVSGISFQGMAIEVKNGLVKVEHWVAVHLREVFGAVDVKK